MNEQQHIDDTAHFAALARDVDRASYEVQQTLVKLRQCSERQLIAPQRRLDPQRWLDELHERNGKLQRVCSEIEKIVGTQEG